MNAAENYRRFLQGDTEGLAELIREFKDGLILYLTGIVGEIRLAEELTEDTFVKLGIKKPKYNPQKASFKTWLYTIARNLAMDHLRRTRRRGEVSVETVGDLADLELLEQRIIRQEDKMVVHRALGKLKSEYRQILWLIYFEELDYRQAAQIMKKSVHGAEMLAYRAKKALAAQLGEEGFVYEGLS